MPPNMQCDAAVDIERKKSVFEGHPLKQHKAWSVTLLT